MQIRTPRSRGVMVLISVLITAAIVAPAAVMASHSFNDVPETHTFHADIDWMLESGITTGCNDGNYCPDSNVTRGQMAAFMRRLATKQVVDAGSVGGILADELLTANSPLLPNQTISGVFAVEGADNTLISAPISFATPLPPLTELLYLYNAPGVFSTSCPAVGHAAPGYLCVYAGHENAVFFEGTGSPVAGGASITEFGTVLFWATSADGANARGTWSVTAPSDG